MQLAQRKILQFLQLFQLFHNESIVVKFNPLPDDKILDWFKLKQIADEILKCI